VNPVPVIVILSPAIPEAGEKVVTVGAGVTGVTGVSVFLQENAVVNRTATAKSLKVFIVFCFIN
jgi:hypothetical protein